MKEQLENNIRSFWISAELVYKSKEYTPATILYFKCLFGILDYILFNKLKKTPKDHAERFQMLKANFPQLYEIIDKYYQLYRDTYSLAIDKEKCEEVRNNVSRIIKEQKIPVNNS